MEAATLAGAGGHADRFLADRPYSYLAGAISLDFGGKQGSSTASGFIDGIGYLGGMMAGDGMARIVVRLGWKGAFLVLGGVAILSTAAAVLFLIEQLRRSTRPRRSRIRFDRRHEDVRQVECLGLMIQLGKVLVDQRLKVLEPVGQLRAHPRGRLAHALGGRTVALEDCAVEPAQVGVKLSPPFMARMS